MNELLRTLKLSCQQRDESILPGSIENAKKGLEHQNQLIARLPDIPTELQAWQAAVNRRFYHQPTS